MTTFLTVKLFKNHGLKFFSQVFVRRARSAMRKFAYKNMIDISSLFIAVASKPRDMIGLSKSRYTNIKVELKPISAALPLSGSSLCQTCLYTLFHLPLSSSSSL